MRPFMAMNIQKANILSAELKIVILDKKVLSLMVRFTENKKYGGDQVAEKEIQVELAPQ